MNKRGQWNLGLGTSLVIGGIYLLTRGTAVTVIIGIILIGFGLWLIFRDKKEK